MYDTEETLNTQVRLTTSSGPIETMLDMVLISTAKGKYATSGFEPLGQIASLFDQDRQELWDRYISDRGFTPLRKILLGIDQCQTVDEFLQQSQRDGTISHVINSPDKRYRTALT